MNFLEEKILKDGHIREGNVLKVDNFLNHQVDTAVITQIAEELCERFRGVKIDKVLTIEASGIAIGFAMSHILGVPLVFAKKSLTVNSSDDQYVSKAYSFTHKCTNNVYVSRPYIKAGERVLVVDDFLADGEASNALIDIINQAGAEVAGIGIAIEKGQQKGGALLRSEGYRVESVAIIEEMDCETQTVTFRPNPA